MPLTTLVSVQAGLHVLAPRLPELVHLQDDVPHKQDQGPGEVVGVDEVGPEIGGVKAGQVLDGAGRVHDVGRVAGEHIAPAGAIVDQEAVPVGAGTTTIDLNFKTGTGTITQ